MTGQGALVTTAGLPASKQMQSAVDVAYVKDSRLQLRCGSSGIPAFSAVQRQRHNLHGVVRTILANYAAPFSYIDFFI